MQSVAAIACAWIAQRRQAAVARVIAAEGLGPRPTGDLLFVDADSRIAGALLGGVANSEVAGAARDVLATEAIHAVLALQVESGDAAAAGLTCGGTVEILLQRLDTIPVRLWEELAAGRPAALVSPVAGEARPVVVLPGGALTGSLGESALDTLAQAEAEAMLTHAGPVTSRVTLGDVRLVIESWNAAPRMVIVGSSDLSVALTRQVELLGWSATTVVGAEASLAAVEQLSVSDLLIVIDHDPFVATPVLAAALRRGVGYVGALGSRRTQQSRREYLTELGLRPVEIDRMHGPTGLDIGARTPAETAVSIVAEIIADRTDRTGARLASTTSRISG